MLSLPLSLEDDFDGSFDALDFESERFFRDRVEFVDRRDMLSLQDLEDDFDSSASFNLPLCMSKRQFT